MNQDLDALTLIQNLTSGEFERFKSAIQILISKTFIIRGIEKEREIYDFTIRNIKLFEAWFSCMDADIVRDESNGVIAFRGSGNTRLRFKKNEICAVLVLRLFYDEKKNEVSLTKFPVITIRDFQDKYNAMTGEEIKKTALIDVLTHLSACKLITIDSHDYSDPEGFIQLLPSIPLSIDRDALDTALSILENKDKDDDESMLAENAENIE